MKKLYTLLLTNLFIILLLLYSSHIYSQCTSGYVPSGKAFDTTVSTGSGNYETFFKFPKFPPDSGMVTCVKLTMTITGVYNMAIENHVNTPTSYNATYDRKDSISGPGLGSPLTSSVSKGYGPYNLAAYDNIDFTGADFVRINPDTVLKSVSTSYTITDVNEIANFYGLDSVTYRYAIKAGATLSGSGDYLFAPSTSGFVNYKLEYCYCPPEVLPLGFINFKAEKRNDNEALLSWSAETDKQDHLYEIQVSRDGQHFTTAAVIQRDPGNRPAYTFRYAIPAQQNGTFYFRVKQRYPNGYTRFTNIQNLQFENQLLSKVSLYPNPSNGIVGIKFVNISAGKINIQINNIQGQTVVNKELAVDGTAYKQIATLQKGMYWMKITDAAQQQTVVHQIFIK